MNMYLNRENKLIHKYIFILIREAHFTDTFTFEKSLTVHFETNL